MARLLRRTAPDLSPNNRGFAMAERRAPVNERVTQPAEPGPGYRLRGRGPPLAPTPLSEPG